MNWYNRTELRGFARPILQRRLAGYDFVRISVVDKTTI